MMKKQIQHITSKTGIPISAVYIIMCLVFGVAGWMTRQEFISSANAKNLIQHKNIAEKRLLRIENKLDRLINLLLRESKND